MRGVARVEQQFHDRGGIHAHDLDCALCKLYLWTEKTTRLRLPETIRPDHAAMHVGGTVHAERHALCAKRISRLGGGNAISHDLRPLRSRRETVDDDFGPLVKLPCHAELGDNNLIGWPGRGNRAFTRREGPDRGGPVILIEGVP